MTTIFTLIQQLLEIDLPPDTPVSLKIIYPDGQQATELVTGVYFEDSDKVIIEAEVKVNDGSRITKSPSNTAT